MTVDREIETGRLSRGQLLFCIMSAVAMMITFIYSDIAIEAMSAGLALCTNTVIPSLFPFMVLSELLVSSGASELAGKYIARPLGYIFDLSDRAAAALLLGLVCGFPIGSKSAVSMYTAGQISRGELEHVLSFCNIPSSAFLISAVGVGLFGSRTFGVLLYISHVISALCVGLLGKRYFSRKKKMNEHLPIPAAPERVLKGFVHSFTKAVSDSAGSMLMICAFLVFFSALSGIVRLFAENARLSDLLCALIIGAFEMTGGVSSAASLSPMISAIATSVITAWSGLSVAFQLIGLCKDTRISVKPYFVLKMISALISGALVAVFLHLWGYAIPLKLGDSTAFLPTVPIVPLSHLRTSLFIVGCLLLKRKKS